VKVRGHRIELGEVELALLDHPAIKEAVVVAREDEPEDTRLVAYVVPGARPAPTAGALRRFLTEKLPSYMVPAAFVTLEALPMTANNKVDRRALPRPSRARPDVGSAYATPRTAIENDVARIWAEVLSIDEVGIHDNFLELGGDSLRATRIVSRVLDTFRVELESRSLLEAATVADMAVAITVELMAEKGVDIGDVLEN